MSGFVSTTWRGSELPHGHPVEYLRRKNKRRVSDPVAVRLAVENISPFHQVIELVVGEGLGRIQVKRTCVGILGDALEDWKVVAQRLSRCGGRDNNDIASRFS
jgi:hypothetical protein